MEETDEQLRDRVEPAPGVLARALGGEVVLLDVTSGRYFGLDPAGKRIWELLAEEGTLADVVSRLEQEFDAGRDVLTVDLLELIGELERNGLVTRVRGRQGEPGAA